MSHGSHPDSTIPPRCSASRTLSLLATALACCAASPVLAEEPRHINKCGVVLDEPGSYILTRNLRAISPESCIEVAARYVSIDLNGYAIIGEGERVEGFNGIWAEPETGLEGIAVRNGSVHHFHDGIALEGAAACVVENVRVVFNANNGIGLHTGLARGNVIWANGTGVYCINAHLVENVFNFGNAQNVEDVFGDCTYANNGEVP